MNKNIWLEMLLGWARDNRVEYAIGWIMRDDMDAEHKLDPVERQYAWNVVWARIRGVSA